MLIPLCFSLAVAAAAPAPVPIVRTAGEERLTVPRGALQRLDVDSLAGKVHLWGAPARLRSALSASKLCPMHEVSAKKLTLTCTTRRFEASFDANVLTLRALVGIPPSEGEAGLPTFLFAPDQVGLNGTCQNPATSAARAECALVAGDHVAAERELASALTEGYRDYALVRLADDAIAQRDFAKAVGLLRGVGRSGPWMRLANARRCQIEGSCFRHGTYSQGYDPLDIAALSPPLRREMTLRRARALAYTQRWDDVLELLVNDPSVCRGAVRFCKRLNLEVLRQEEANAVLAVVLHASLPSRPRIAEEVELAQRVARRSQSEGGFAFAAGVLAGVSDIVEPSELEAHLDETARRFLDAGDEARATVVLRFAASRFGGTTRARLARMKSRHQHPSAKVDVGLQEMNRAKETAARVRRKLYGVEDEASAKRQDTAGRQ